MKYALIIIIPTSISLPQDMPQKGSKGLLRPMRKADYCFSFAQSKLFSSVVIVSTRKKEVSCPKSLFPFSRILLSTYLRSWLVGASQEVAIGVGDRTGTTTRTIWIKFDFVFRLEKEEEEYFERFETNFFSFWRSNTSRLFCTI